MAQTLSLLSMISYILAAVFFVTAVILFFVLRIPRTFNDYTGRSARKKIMKIRDSNENVQKQSQRSDQGKKGKRKASAVPPYRPAGGSNDDMPDTGVIAENKARRYDTEETAMLEETTAELNEPAPVKPARPAEVKLKMLDEIVFIHTEEVIP